MSNLKPYWSTQSRQFLFYNLFFMTGLEFLQNGLISFSSTYLCGYLGMTRHMYSAATALYSGIAVIMIASHQWLVGKLGYRNYIQWSLFFFVAGGLVCSQANDVVGFMSGRAIQALGGSAFFTTGRVFAQRFDMPERVNALRHMAVGLMFFSAVASMVGSVALEYFNWRALFIIPIIPAAITGWLTLHSVTNAPYHHRKGALHPGSMLMLVASIFMLEYASESAPYDFFSNQGLFYWLIGLAVIGVGMFVWHEMHRPRPLLSFRHIMQSRYVWGLIMYAVCYLAMSSSNYLVPIFMQSGLSFPVLNCGGILSGTAMLSIVVALAHLKMVGKFPKQKKYLVFGFASLAGFGLLSSDMTPDAPLWEMVIPLLCLSCFSSVGQASAALNTFRETDNMVFSQAYQTKNMLREIMNSAGVSISNVLLQSREALHYNQIAEGVTERSYHNATFKLPISQLSTIVSHQTTVMACLDIFLGIGCVGLIGVGLSLVQKKFV